MDVGYEVERERLELRYAVNNGRERGGGGETGNGRGGEHEEAGETEAVNE